MTLLTRSSPSTVIQSKTPNDIFLTFEGSYMGELTDRVTGIVHEATQTDGQGLDLTLAEVYRVSEPGQVDFGGDELVAPGLSEKIPEQRESGDDYGWWSLDSGTYLIAHNESLDSGDPLTLQTHDAVLARGAHHPTLRVTELDRVPLTVGGSIQLKENARISTLYEKDR